MTNIVAWIALAISVTTAVRIAWRDSRPDSELRQALAHRRGVKEIERSILNAKKSPADR